MSAGWKVNGHNGAWLTDPDLDDHHRGIIAWLLEHEPEHPGDVTVAELCEAIESGQAADALRRARAVLS